MTNFSLFVGNQRQWSRIGSEQILLNKKFAALSSCLGCLQWCSGAGTQRNAVPVLFFLLERRSGTLKTISARALHVCAPLLFPVLYILLNYILMSFFAYKSLTKMCQSKPIIQCSLFRSLGFYDPLLFYLYV